MTHFKNITIFENKKRVKNLEDFRALIVEYFANVRHSWQADAAIENARAEELRPQINKAMRSAMRATVGVGISSSATYLPPPAVGGYRQNFNFFSDVFRLRDFGTTEEPLLDYIDRAIGIYTDDQGAAKFRTFNPFWWLGRVLAWVARTPFMIASAAGFDTSKIEESLLGKLIRLAVWLVGAAAGVVTLITYWQLK